MRLIFISVVLIVVFSNCGICQLTKIGVNLAYNEIYYHTGKSNDGLPDFNIGVSSASIAFHLSKKLKEIGFTFEPGLIEKAGLFENNRKNIVGFRNEYHLNFFILGDFYPTRKLNFSIGPEFTFPLANTRISDNQINFGSIIFGINYNLLKRIDTGVRFKYGVLPIQSILFTDENGTFQGEGKYSNDYIQLYFRFNLFNNMDIIDLKEKTPGRRKQSKRGL